MRFKCVLADNSCMQMEDNEIDETLGSLFESRLQTLVFEELFL